VVTAAQQRAAADYLGEAYGVSQRRASRVLRRARSTLRYRRRPRAGEPALVRAIRRLARRHPRFGYKRIHARLVHQGWRVNLKRTRRLWIELGLRRQFRRRKTRKLGPKPGTSANSCTNQPARFKNDVWTYDFIADRTIDGGALKWLSLVDEYTRECLALAVGETVTGADVRRVLARVIGRRGAPTRIRSDNGSEFICSALAAWLPQVGARSIPVAPASPWENGFIESFHSRLRDEFLECQAFESVADARARAAWWRREYNRIRPHSALEYQTPKMFSDQCDRGLHGQPPTNQGNNASTCVNGTPISSGPRNG
jgi:putative transposase